MFYYDENKSELTEMDHMIERQIVAFDMEAFINATGRHKVQITIKQDGMEVTVGELLVPTFYFMS